MRKKFGLKKALLPIVFLLGFVLVANPVLAPKRNFDTTFTGALSGTGVLSLRRPNKNFGTYEGSISLTFELEESYNISSHEDYAGAWDSAVGGKTGTGTVELRVEAGIKTEGKAGLEYYFEDQGTGREYRLLSPGRGYFTYDPDTGTFNVEFDQAGLSMLSAKQPIPSKGKKAFYTYIPVWYGNLTFTVTGTEI